MRLDDGFGVVLWVAFALLAFACFVQATDPTFVQELGDFVVWLVR